MERKLRFWLEPDTCFIILRDQDAEDCMAVKNRLLGIVERSGKRDASLVRIACHELESFFLGDLAAVAAGLGIPGLTKLQKKNPYRRADSIADAAEELKKITGNRYRKPAGSRAIGPCLDLSGANRSHSFKVLVDGILRQIRRLSTAV